MGAFSLIVVTNLLNRSMDSDDDLIGILDDVSNSGNRAVATQPYCGDVGQNSTAKKTSKTSLLEDLLEEFSDHSSMDSEKYEIKSQNASPGLSSQVKSQTKTTCSNPKMGPCKDVNSSKTYCDTLHCLKCDNKVIKFPDKQWVEDSCDYLFFRNSYPNPDRLQRSWVDKTTCHAYCCQCNWVSILSLTEVNSVRGLQWICAKH